MIEGQNIHKTFKDFWGRPKVHAVKGVDISVKKGSVFALLGPNGAGKSTLIKMFLGHLYPTKGIIRVLGKDPRDVETKNNLGYLPEKTNLYKNLTAGETLRFFAKILNLSGKEIEMRTQQLLEMVGLNSSRKRLVGEFSHGMGRRMGLAQALINDPDLLLLDEPTAGLDPIGCREVKDLIITLAKRGKTILITSHLLADIEDVCDEMMIIYGGQIRESGQLSELLADKSQIQFTLPRPQEKKLNNIKQLLIEHSDNGKVELSNPTRSLESYFLDIVTKAEEKHLETGGAHMGKGVASYLQDGLTTDELLTNLTKKEKQEKEEPQIEQIKPDTDALDKLKKKKTQAEKISEKPAKKIDKSALDKLTK